MDFRLTEDEELFQKVVREFCDKRLRPRSREIDDTEQIPLDLLKQMAELKLLGITIPEQYGGAGATNMMTALAAIEIGRGDISMATAVYYLLEAGWAYILNLYGTEDAKQEVFPPVVAGDAFIGIATTEPGGGSDLANVKTTARREGDYYVLNGEKAFISGVIESSQRLPKGGGHLTLVRTDPARGYNGMTFMYVPIRTQGITVTQYKDMGRMGISTGGIFYKEAKVPARYVLGEENKGFYYAMSGFNAARTQVAAACVGAAERALEIGIEYVKQREAFGRPIGKFEGVQFEIADQYGMTEMIKLAVLKAASLIDQNPEPDSYMQSEITKIVSICKLYAPQIAFETVKRAMMWYGAAGYTKENDLEMGLRGVMSYMVGAEGALNIMRVILGRELLGKEFIPYK